LFTNTDLKGESDCHFIPNSNDEYSDTTNVKTLFNVNSTYKRNNKISPISVPVGAINVSECMRLCDIINETDFQDLEE